MRGFWKLAVVSMLVASCGLVAKKDTKKTENETVNADQCKLKGADFAFVKGKCVQKPDAIEIKDPNLFACIDAIKDWESDEENAKLVDVDGDGVIRTDEALNLKSLSCPGKNITDLTGILEFKNLEYLNCSSNQLGALPDFSTLENLNELRCVNNFFSDYDCPVRAKIVAKKLDVLELDQQRDGRTLSCDKIKLVQRFPLADPDNNSLNDVWGFTQDKVNYGVYGSLDEIFIIKTLDKAPWAEKVATLPRGKKKAALYTDPTHSVWGEYRYYAHEGRGYLYASSEGNRETEEAPVLQLFDVTDMAKIKTLEVVDDPEKPMGSIHNITLDQERQLLYAFGGTDHAAKPDENGRRPSQKGARVYDISNPVKPKYLRTVGDLYIHDGQVETKKLKNGEMSYKLFVAHGSGKIHWDANLTTYEENRIRVYDLADVKDANVESMPILLDTQYPFGYCHNIWVTEDGGHVVVTGETSIDNQMSFWKLDYDKKEASFVNGVNLQGNSFAHNAFVRGDYVYVSHYSKGVQVLEIEKDKHGDKSMKLVWSYDTFPEHNDADYSGSWGVYPFSNDDRTFFATDGTSGLHVFRKMAGFDEKK